MAFLESLRIKGNTYRFPLYHNTAVSPNVIYSIHGIPGTTRDYYFLNTSSMLKLVNELGRTIINVVVNNGSEQYSYQVPGYEYILSNHLEGTFLLNINSYSFGRDLPPVRYYFYNNGDVRGFLTFAYQSSYNFAFNCIALRSYRSLRNDFMCINILQKNSDYINIPIYYETETWSSEYHKWVSTPPFDIDYTFNNVIACTSNRINIIVNGHINYQRETYYSNSTINNFDIRVYFNFGFIDHYNLSYTPPESYYNVLIFSRMLNINNTPQMGPEPPYRIPCFNVDYYQSNTNDFNHPILWGF